MILLPDQSAAPACIHLWYGYAICRHKLSVFVQFVLINRAGQSRFCNPHDTLPFVRMEQKLIAIRLPELKPGFTISRCFARLPVHSVLSHTKFFVFEIDYYCLIPKQSIPRHTICFIIYSKPAMVCINFYITKAVFRKFKCIGY